MARKIIITDVAKQASGDFAITAVFWLAAPANRTIKKPGAASKVPDATTTELDALVAGTVVEAMADTGLYPSTTTPAAVKADLQTRYNTAQSALNATAAGANFIGLVWDGTNWA